MNSKSAKTTRELAIEMLGHCRNFTEQNNKRALWQLVSTLLPFLLICVIIGITVSNYYWVTLLLIVPAAGFLVRLFLLQHDCGHGSFFASKSSNDLLGRLLSLLTFTPFSYWRTTHAIHHATTGNLDRRGVGDIYTLTVEEYRVLKPLAKIGYRLIRNPLCSLLVGPPVHFLILQRVPGYRAFKNKAELLSIILHDVALVLFYCALIYVIGFEIMVFGFLPVVVIAACIGSFLFIVQHQFEETSWDDAESWDAKIAALKGSSHLQMPAILNWLTCDIGLHHIHHLSSRIPNYRLRECLETNEALRDIAPKLTLWQAMTSMHLALWDEAERRLISFREYRLQRA
jgi:omega-6 fatty acid desaturase (delta-12 desaturase)